MNSKQGTRYIKRRMGNDLKRQILIQNGIIENKRYRKNHQFLIVLDVIWLMQSITNTVRNVAILWFHLHLMKLKKLKI